MLIKSKHTPPQISRKIMQARRTAAFDEAVRRIVRQIPRGKVATYAQVAAAAGYPIYHRQVVQVLRTHGEALPWQRVLGAGGHIRLPLDAGLEQRLRLELEGVQFSGKHVNMTQYQHQFRGWEFG